MTVKDLLDKLGLMPEDATVEIQFTIVSDEYNDDYKLDDIKITEHKLGNDRKVIISGCPHWR